VYRFAVKPSISFYFQTPLEVSLDRILSSRPELKYHEAGLDLGLTTDPAESFKIFQGRIKAHYDEMAQRERFHVVDATKPVEDQQRLVRAAVAAALRNYVTPSM